MIALDYDYTWTLRPALWRAFVALAKAHGMDCVVVTNRGPESPITEVLPCAVLYSAGAPKREATKAAGLTVAIWIDDFPHLVDLGHGHPVAHALGLP